MAEHYIVRVISNNAVFARSESLQDVILVGRGIGFGAKAGDVVNADATLSYAPVDPEKAQLLKALDSIDTTVLAVVTDAVELAADLLGDLDPSIYLLLAEHLSFAIQRVTRGETISNPLLGEIHAAFPDEFNAAELVVSYLNAHLDVHIPGDEAAFIALHLNAARTGASVKQPLAKANAVAKDLQVARQAMGVEGDDSLAITLVRLRKLLTLGVARSNAAAYSIARDLPDEYRAASIIICHMLELDTLPRKLQGEASNLAVFLHAWKQLDVEI